jgi:hypothetical protein
VKRARIPFAVLFLVMVQEALSAGVGAVASEYEVKAAFVYNFTRFVQWPEARASGPLDICVMGEDPFGSAIDEAVENKRIGGREITVTRLSDVEKASACEVLFIAPSEHDKVERIVKTLARVPVLTVGDIEDFAERGGMINLTKQGSHIRFEINVDALERAGLRASSQLLGLATIVGDIR